MIDNPFLPVLHCIERFETDEFLIEEERQNLLRKVAQSISEYMLDQKEAQIITICTHNSRRSQLSELWIRVAADHYDIPLIRVYSGGTEETAFNTRMIQAIDRAGFHIYQKSINENSQYEIHWKHNQASSQSMFSKKYHDPFNPQQGFIAILVCDQADQGCPVVFGADVRYYVGYEDPKHADNKPNEASIYDAKVSEIGREMIYLMRAVKSLISTK